MGGFAKGSFAGEVVHDADGRCLMATRAEGHISALQRAGALARRIMAKGAALVFPSKDYVTYRGSVLPPRGMRFNEEDQRDDRILLASSIREASRVIEKLGYSPHELIVDIGSGQGRLATGLLRSMKNARYLGIDVSADSVAWCRRNITARHPSYQFQHIDVVNARYNPSGVPLSVDFRLPVADGAADIVYMWGLVTNMEPEHLAAYAAETSRMLRQGGRLFLTANIEDDVPTVSINPDNYTAFACTGPLHLVRYERRYFIDVFERAGLRLTELSHHAVGSCQSELYFVRA
jgi:SAM-dependent methyltransferase